MGTSGCSASSANRAVSCRRDTDSVTRNVVRLCMNTVIAAIIRKLPIASATMSSISVMPNCVGRPLSDEGLNSFITAVDLHAWNASDHLVVHGSEPRLLPGHLDRVCGWGRSQELDRACAV